MNGLRNIDFEGNAIVFVKSENVLVTFDLRGVLRVWYKTSGIIDTVAARMLTSIQTLNKTSFFKLKQGTAMLVQADIKETQDNLLEVNMEFETKNNHQPRILYEGRAIRFQVYASSDFRRFMPRVGRILPGTRGGPGTRRRNW